MATEEVGNLKVKLGMDTAEFQKSMTSMNKNLQTLGQQFRTLQNKGKDWGGTIDGLKSKQSKLSELLEGQKNKVSTLAAQYQKAKTEQGEYSKQAEQLAYQLAKAEAEMQKTETELGQITAELRKQEAELQRSQSNWDKFGEMAKAAGEKLKAVGDGMKNVGKELSMKVTAPLTALGVGAAKAAIDFESAFAGVRKTVNTSEEGFKKLEKGILEMARTLPASASEIAAVAESAGQLGIAEENILDFTKTIINLGEATNLTAEQGASEFARFANIVGMSQQDFDRLGSSIVALGNTMATTESEIMSMGMRLAAQGAQIGMTESDILALSATMSSLGIEAEAGGTAMSTVLKKMQNAVSNGGKALGEFAEAAKVSSEDFSTAFKEDPVQALDMFIKGLAQSAEEGENLNEILGYLGIKGIRETDTVLRMVGASDLLSEALGTSGTAWGENTALANEAAQRYETTASQLAMLKNRIVEVGISFGSVMLPFLIQIVDTLSPVITKFTEMDGSIQKVILVIAGIAAAIGPVLVVLGTLISSLGSIIGVFGVISGAIASAGGVMGLLSGAMASLGSAFAVLIGPIGLTVAAIVGIVAALVIAYNKVEWFREGVQNIFSAIVNSISNSLNAMKSFIMDIWSQIQTFWSTNGEQIKQATENVFNGIKAVVDFIMPGIKLVIEVVMFAIKFIVEGIWNAIKGVIQGALNIILGLVKVFSSLFTGDWKGLWEGVKQLLMGVVEFIWNLMQLMFYGRIIKGLASFAKLFSSSFTSLWTGIKSLFSKSIEFIKGVFTNGFNTMKSSATNIMGSISKTISTVWNGIKNIFATVINAIKSVISTGFNSYVTLVKNTLNKIVSTVTNMGSKMIQAGKDLINGLIKGMKEMGTAAIEAVTGVVDGVITKAKNLLGIHSPSRVFAAFGRFVSQGLAIGITDDADKVQAAVTEMVDVAKKTAEQQVKDLQSIVSKANRENLADIVKIKKDAAAEEVKITKDTNNKIADIEKASSKKLANTKKLSASQRATIIKEAEQKIAKVEADANAKRIKLSETTATKIAKVESQIAVDKLKAIKEDAEARKQAGEMNAQAEAAYWKYTLTAFEKGSKEHTEAMKMYNKAVESYNKEMLGNIESYITDKKSLDQLSLKDEVIIWEQNLQNFAEGSNERLKAQKNYKTALDTLNKEVVSINQNFQSQMQKISDDLIKQEEALTKAYEDTVKNRYNTLMGFASTFDAYTLEMKSTGEELKGNLQAQVDAMKLWQEQFNQISNRGIDENLLEELSGLGVKALPELIALNSLTDEQLSEYSSLYAEKSQLAREQAEKELIGMKDDTENQIISLREVADEQLSKLQVEWELQIKGLTQTTANELSSLRKIGADAGQGLLNGLASMEGPLINKAQQIANAIKEAMQSALDIHSPSRVMKGFGINIGQGLIEGMNSMLSAVEKSSTGLASAVVGGQNSYDYSRSFAPSVNIYTQDSGSREMDRTLRRLAFRMG